MSSFQERVKEWITHCFGSRISEHKQERCLRFLEEALELAQSCDLSREYALKILEYVYSRPRGKIHQEIGGVMITLAALTSCLQEDMQACGELELSRVWVKIQEIRAKQASKIQVNIAED